MAGEGEGTRELWPLQVAWGRTYDEHVKEARRYGEPVTVAALDAQRKALGLVWLTWAPDGWMEAGRPADAARAMICFVGMS